MEEKSVVCIAIGIFCVCVKKDGEMGKKKPEKW